MSRYTFPLFLCLLLTHFTYAQPVYNDGMIEYSVSVAGNKNAGYAAYLQDASMQLYIRGMHTRSELKTGLGTTITILDQQVGSAVILNEYGGQKIMLNLKPEEYKKANSKYDNPSIEYIDSTKTINGYKCMLAKVKFSDGRVFSIYYTVELKFHCRHFDIPVEIKGLPLEYEAEIGGSKVIYQARQISTSPVSAGLFDIPKSGYREMKFDEMPKY
jgi:GLPGLI family protein